MPTSKMPAKGHYDVVDDVFRYTSKAGAHVVIDLDFPAEVMDAALGGATTESEQFDVIAEWLGEDLQATYAKLGGLEKARFMRTFFTEFSKAAMLPLGESLSSSAS